MTEFHLSSQTAIAMQITQIGENCPPLNCLVYLQKNLQDFFFFKFLFTEVMRTLVALYEN